MNRSTGRRVIGAFWWAVAAVPLVGFTWWGIARMVAVRRARSEGTVESLDSFRGPMVREIDSSHRHGATTVRGVST